MAKQTLNNGEVQLSFRTKLNDMFTEIYNSITSLGASITSLISSSISMQTTLNSHTVTLSNQVTTNTAVAADLAGIHLTDTSNSDRLTALENVGATIVSQLTPTASFSVTTTATILHYFDAIVLQAGTKSTANITTQELTVDVTGTFKVSGNIVLEFPQSNEVSLQLYKNGLAVTPPFSTAGLGSGKSINIGYNTALSLVATDVLTLMATSTLGGTFSCVLTGSSVTFEKTIY
ncbi:MAG: hypothetical protein JHC33_09605 [Ignisphaera sp.]|nr:hypothetical protein [Ignisphaera sp.]